MLVLHCLRSFRRSSGRVRSLRSRRQTKWALALLLIAAVCATSYLPQFKLTRDQGMDDSIKISNVSGIDLARISVACGQPVPAHGRRVG